MEATMEATTPYERAHEPVGFAGALVHEFKLLWTSRRPLLLLVAVVGLLAIVGRPWAGGSLARLIMVWPVYAAVVGPVWAFAVLTNEGPSHRHYHWSQPVTRHAHSLGRVAAGLIWLWLVYALLAAAAFAFGAAEGNASQLVDLGGLAWLNLFTGALIGYLAISVLTVASDHPIRWFLGILFLLPLALSLLTEWLGLETLAETIARPLTDPEWGLGAALVGAVAAGATGVLRAVADAEAGAPPFDPTTWGLATLLWTALFAVLVIAAAVIHPDTKARLRPGRPGSS